MSTLKNFKPYGCAQGDDWQPLPRETSRFIQVCAAPLPHELITIDNIREAWTMDNKEKVRLLRLHHEVCRRNFQAWHEYEQRRREAGRAALFARLFSGQRASLTLPPEPEYEPYPDISGFQCGATTRAGTPCKMTYIYRNGRCKLHGGKSTGAKTRAGRKRQRDGYRAWLEKQRASNAGRKRTRAYTRDVTGIGGATLAEISASATARVLSAVSGIALHFTGESLTAALTDAHSVTVALTTTSPKYGGVRWWYVCPDCEKRKAALYVSGTALICRQCAGLHYASQSK
ncbi:HGGxSTG domain-containing protein [Enterobacter ludwigii]|uniref:HGGxSTG domain-containing protein n=1 Tax=Enterobacter ludwigii TaxID=299767 RepID=UPI0012D3CE7B|nr:HGGxSTG domain-containing protein [Enterobacter ludwigii]